MSNEEKRKNEIISKLQTLYSCGVLKPHDHHGWQMKRPKYIPVVSRQNGKSITNLYLAAKQAGLPLEQIKELIKDVCGYDC